MENPLPTCDPHLVPLVSSRSKPFTPRRAVDSSGRVGSLYDACQDQVLLQPTLQCKKKLGTSRHLPSCLVKPYNSKESKSLLEWYNMHYELRLSVALQLVQKVGVGDMLNYPHPIDEYTRFISYNYCSHTDYVPDEELHLLSRNKTSMPDVHATHVIVLVNWGVHALAIVQLPDDPESISRIDDALMRLCASLENGHATLLHDDKHLLQTVCHTEVFSSISTLTKITSILDFPREINRVKKDVTLFKPYNYNLCAIETFYTLNDNRTNKFTELGSQRIRKIEDYLGLLSSRIKRFRAIIDQPHRQVKQYLNEQHHEVSTNGYV